MKCPSCGKIITEDSNFCEYCGKAVHVMVGASNVPELIYDLPDDIRKWLLGNRLVPAINACKDRYCISQDDAAELVNKMYLQSLLFAGKKLQAIKHYCITKHIGLKESKDIIDRIELSLKNNPIK